MAFDKMKKGKILVEIKVLNTERILIHHASQQAKDEIVAIGKEELMKIEKTTRISATDKHHSQFVI